MAAADSEKLPWYDQAMQGVSDPLLRFQILRALAALPWWEQTQIRVLGVRFQEGELADSHRARTQLHTSIPDGRAPMPRITLDPSKYTGETADRTLKTILHELAHAIYRTPEIQHVFSANAVTYDGLGRLFETFCDDMADTWFELAKQQEETAA